MRAAVLLRLNGMAGLVAVPAPAPGASGKGSGLLTGAALPPSPAAAAGLVAAARQLFAAPDDCGGGGGGGRNNAVDDGALPLSARFGALSVACHAAAEAAHAPPVDTTAPHLPLLQALHAAYQAVCAVDAEDRWTDAAADAAELVFLADNAAAIAMQADDEDGVTVPRGAAAGRGSTPRPRKQPRPRAEYQPSHGASLTMLPVASGASSSSDEEEGFTGQEEDEEGSGCDACGEVRCVCARAGAMMGRRVDVGIPFAPALAPAPRRPLLGQHAAGADLRSAADGSPLAATLAAVARPLQPPRAGLAWVVFRRLPPALGACLDRPDMPTTDPDFDAYSAPSAASSSSSAAAVAVAVASTATSTAASVGTAAGARATTMRRGLRGDALLRAVEKARDDAAAAARCALFALRCEAMWAAAAAVRALPKAPFPTHPATRHYSIEPIPTPTPTPTPIPAAGATALAEATKWELLAYWSGDLLRAVADGLTVRTLRAYVDLLQVRPI